MKQSDVKKNYIFHLMYQVITVLAPVITAPYLSRILGPDKIGEYSFASSVVAYFVLVSALGTNMFGQREISYVTDDFNERNKKFWDVEILRIILSLICVTLYVVFLCLTKCLNSTYLALSVLIIVTPFDITWFFQGVEKFDLVAIRNVLFKIFSIVLIFIFVKEKNDLTLYILITVLSQLISSFAFWPMLKKYIATPSIKDIHIKETFINSFMLFVPTIAISIYTILDKTMIGLITGSDFENGIYEQSTKIVRALLPIVTAVSTVLMPRIGNLFAHDKTSEIKELMYKSYLLSCFIGLPACLGIVAVTDFFVPIFFGTGYEKVITVLAVLSFTIPLVGVSGITGNQYLLATGRTSLYTKSVVLGSISNVVLNLFLIYFWGSIGAAIASVIAELVVMLSQLIYIRRELSILRIIVGSLKYLLSSLVMLSVILLEKTFVKTSVLNLLLLIASGFFAYILMLLIFRDKLIIEGLNYIKDKLVTKHEI